MPWIPLSSDQFQVTLAADKRAPPGNHDESRFLSLRTALYILSHVYIFPPSDESQDEQSNQTLLLIGVKHSSIFSAFDSLADYFTPNPPTIQAPSPPNLGLCHRTLACQRGDTSMDCCSCNVIHPPRSGMCPAY